MLEDFEYLTRLAEDLLDFAKSPHATATEREAYLTAHVKIAAAALIVLELADAEAATPSDMLN